MFKFGVKLFTDAYEIYKELNPNTLSGAIDVIVVEQADGKILKSTPFYVRFGKIGVLRTKEKSKRGFSTSSRLLREGAEIFLMIFWFFCDALKVDIEVNDQLFTAVKMVLDDNGDGYFVDNETLSTNMCPSNRVGIPSKPRNISASCPDLRSAVNLITPSGSSTSIHINNSKLMKLSFKKKFKKLSVKKISKILDSDSKVRKVSWVYGSYNGRSVRGIIHINHDLQDCNRSTATVSFDNCAIQNTKKEMSIYSERPLIASPTSPNAVKPANGIFKKFADFNFRYRSYFDFTVAIPVLIKALVFSKPITDDFIAKLCHNKKPLVIQPKVIDKDVQHNAVEPSRHSSWFPWRLSNLYKHPINNEVLQKSDSSSLIPDRSPSSDFSIRNHPATHSLKKSLCLSSDELKKMNLKYDELNTVKFSITTKYQGTYTCQCSIFVWKSNDKIVISDIDGTITKSDVLGHFMPLVGHQWDQPNVVDLFKNISRNGYRLIYLSARAIGQAQYTKDYLKSVMQNGRFLPNGPLLLSPTSLFGALHREVIEKKPEVFKIDCLLKIKALFPSRLNPFYAGFGNKATDEITYKSCGIHSSRIFNIDPSGRVNFLDRKLSATPGAL
uniref:LNS2/PITP domain-containing protein n=1 Tax=Romanomermis culicivorax TaxID=13658 RepID=A0A915JML2_ROMCU